jgi:hydroxymethylglutaryl-CoA synthase
MKGIVSYGVYLPYWRLQRKAITGSLGSGGGKGARSVASFDEDTTSMAVEAGRIALRQAPEGAAPSTLWFSTTVPAYADKTNATAVHAALSLDSGVAAFDACGSVGSAVGAAWAAYMAGGLAILSDIRTGLPGGADESNGGDGAVAILFGEGDRVIAEVIGGAVATGEFTDRWRVPGEAYSKQWEERFGEFAYAPFVEQAVADALKGAGLSGGDLDHVILSGLHGRAVKASAKTVGARAEAYADDLAAEIGNAGAAQFGIVLADVLDRAQPGQTIAVVTLADSVAVWLLRTTEALATYQRGPSVRAQIAATKDTLAYAQFLTWRGFLKREPPRRPEPERPAGPPSLRSTKWKYGFYGSRDEGGFLHLPPSRVSMGSGAIDQMEPVCMADVQATIATFTVDRLAFSLSPPVVAAVVDFDGGGRMQCELTDVDPETVRIGDRVEMTFRRLYTQDGIHEYFWKARPIRNAQGSN